MVDLQIEPGALAAELASGELIHILDVREPEEFALAALPEARLVPLGLLPEKIHELAEWRDENVVVCCHHGIRSWHALQWLRNQGFSRVRNLSGGIDAWSREVDPAMPRY